MLKITGDIRGIPLRPLAMYALVAASLSLAGACSRPLELPSTPHYDIVAYEDRGTKTPMKTFVVSYGFTDFVERDGKIFQIDRFVHASHMINQRGVESSFSDAATASIKPRVQEVQLYEGRLCRDSRWGARSRTT